MTCPQKQDRPLSSDRVGSGLNREVRIKRNRYTQEGDACAGLLHEDECEKDALVRTRLSNWLVSLDS